ncbi:hypothetical protein [Nonomuraea sp. NPDC050310]|uniref:hypothetical protein n=1 Tax=Nonomuraea sp. NPDC050310 TaxID=3154935 RepID=UPI0033CDDC4D
MSFPYPELVSERMHTMHREAAEQRLLNRVRRVERARRDLRRAADRLHRALTHQL